VSDIVFILEVPTPQRTPALNYLAREGVTLTAMYFQAADSDHGWGELPIAHDAITIPQGAVRSVLFAVRSVLRADTKALCCFGYWRPACIAAIFVARLSGKQVITRSDSNYATELRRPLMRRYIKGKVLRGIFGAQARVWTIGQQNDLYWNHMGFKNRQLIPYGVPEPPVGVPEDRNELRRRLHLGDETVFLVVGVLEPWKGLHDVLSAFRRLQCQSARLIIVGQGSLVEDVRGSAEADSRILYVGAVENASLGAWYAASDVLVLASHREAWGLVVNEAQANGLPVLVSDAVGSVPDLISDATGWVYPAGDQESLLAHMSRICENDASSLRIEPVKPYNSAPAMMADLIALGAVSARTNTAGN
jgi:glycosyltransferase involved in cell wall biosynthesis